MTSISYEDIFSYFLGNITDYKIAEMETSDAYSLMSEYLHKTISNPYTSHLFSSIQLDDDIQKLSYEMSFAISDSIDEEFVKNILSRGMVVEWLKPQVRSRVNVAQMFAGKEQKFYSQSNHLSELRSLLEDTELEIRTMIRDRGYVGNSYLKGDS